MFNLYVSASIKEENLASKRTWEKNGAKMELLNNRCLVSIDLSKLKENFGYE